MSRKSREVQVGVAVVVAAIVFVAGTLWFQHFAFDGDRVTYEVDFEAVDGLKPGDRVQVRGIRMGVVEDFALVEGGVRVTIEMRPEADLREDAGLRLMTVGLVGEMVIEITPGSGASVAAGHVFTGETVLSIAGMTDLVSTTLESVGEISRDLKTLLGNLNEEDRVGAAVDDTREAANAFGDLIEENRTGLRETVDNLAAASGAIREAVAGPDSALAGATADLRGAAVRADSLMTRLDRTAGRLDRIAAALEAGEGSAGMLLQDERLYLRADSTLTSLNRLLRDIRRNPKKYIDLNIF